MAFQGGREPLSALRLRVVANSDSTSDQEEKMKVVDRMTAFFDDCSFESIDQAEEWIFENYSEIETLLSDCRAKIELCNEHYEGEYKNGVYYPEGEYRSLVIRLGEGRGRNFWGTLFPEIALGASSAKKEKSKPVFTFVKDGSVIEARFFIVELFLKNFK
jgi:stage II sporulation protein R